MPIPKPTATGIARVALGRGDQLARAPRELVALAGRADRRDDVDEAAGDVADPRAALGRRGRRDQRHRSPGPLGERLADVLGLAERQVGDDRARAPAAAARAGELVGPPPARTMFA